MNKESIKIKTKVIDQELCIGCNACVCGCNRNALTPGTDKYGYFTPGFDDSKCIGCGKCDNICPVLNVDEYIGDDHIKAFAFVCADDDVLNRSTSGGVFYQLSKEVLDKNGYVCGAAWDDDLNVNHIIIHEISELEKLQKSKYVQSNLGMIYRKIKELLNNGEEVLFSGMPCQIFGLYGYLGNRPPGLTTIDILCGNAPSQLFFKKYLSDSLEGKNVSRYVFRDKVYGWSPVCISYEEKDGKRHTVSNIEDDDYQSLYHDHTMCPKHCENCSFHEMPRIGDVSIGDFWGIEGKIADIPRGIGVSAVICNTRRGYELFSCIPKDCVRYCKEVPIEWLEGNGFVLKGSENFVSPFRDYFYDNILDHRFDQLSHEIHSKRTGFIKIRSDQNLQLLNKISSYDSSDAVLHSLDRFKKSKIAVYGTGEVGKAFVRLLKSRGIDIQYYIDRNVVLPIMGDKVVGANTRMDELDYIIVSVMWDFDNIKKKLETRTRAAIIGVAEALE